MLFHEKSPRGKGRAFCPRFTLLPLLVGEAVNDDLADWFNSSWQPLF